MKKLLRYQCTTTSGKTFIVANSTYQLAWEDANRRYPNQITAMNELPGEHGQHFNGVHLPPEAEALARCPHTPLPPIPPPPRV